ncbi:hypothetical protein EAW52_10625 [Pseudomonas sp. LTJR-52]|uniref:hypothetical protein n=1 Tax=Pseudomonas sp. LTJR-52 TaxID=2479392 RepID=UPI000EFAF107|nr:hypothetical protein [Pseudomonas sp. LTJR-52]AYN94381.1 hypothetical protein EAW52_10625 [Pseudomonas sp. LTJR-52]
MSEESLVYGQLTPETWNDFVKRLRHDCVGAGVKEHYTADAIFKVEAKRTTYGIDPDYGCTRVVLWEESEWFSPQEYWNDAEEDMQENLDRIAMEQGECKFLELSEYDQWEILAELEDHTVTGCNDHWEYVNSHFTKAAAEAFIKRKKHDYPKGLRVYVDAQSYCWEYNTIKEAILSGKLQYVA